MADEKDRFGDTMRLVERAKEDIYFAEQDRPVLAGREYGTVCSPLRTGRADI